MKLDTKAIRSRRLIEPSDMEDLCDRVDELEAVLQKAASSLEWVDKNWTKAAADRGAGLPMCRAALATARKALLP